MTTNLFEKLQTKTFSIGNKQVTFETGRLARSAGGAVLISCDDTRVLVAATATETPRSGIDYFPLLVDVEEKMYAVGRFPGGYLKREGRPSEKATLTCRLIDRPVRPLWPDGYRNDVQIVVSPMSVDGTHQYDVLGILGASMAIELAGLPFEGPIGGVRVGRINGEFVLNPTFAESAESDLDLVVSGTKDSIMMVEAGANFVTETDLIKAIELAHESIKQQVQAQEEFKAQCGIAPKAAFVPEHDLKPLQTWVEELVKSDVHTAYHNFERDERKTQLKAAKEKLEAAKKALPDDNEIKVFLAANQINYLGEAFKKVEKKIMRAMVIDEGVRADGRKMDEIRPIECQVGVLPRAHGSALFTRGSTQVLSICTLGAPGDAQELDGIDPATEKRWMHHYSFPPYSTGEVRFMRGASRRDIGHGALAERAVSFSLPPKEEFPYTLRVNSEVLESNGSSSMASTCGTSLALMDAGVPTKTPTSGIAMGLIKEGDKYAVLSDIQGLEDFLGDMDFKVTGNESGVTALQMDIKIGGISTEIMKVALEQAKAGRLHILGKMNDAINAPRTTLSQYAPRIITMWIDTDQIGMVIGPGGKMIRSIIEATGATIDIEDSGMIIITSVGTGGEKAQEMIQALTKKIERGMVSLGKVVRILPIGAFVELGPNKDGLVHISQLAPWRVAKVEDVVKMGDEVLVKVVEVDERGRVNLTIKGVTNEERAQFGLPPLEQKSPVPQGGGSQD